MICLSKENLTRCGVNWHHLTPHLPNQKQMDLSKKNINMNLLFFNNKLFILNKFFDILNF